MKDRMTILSAIQRYLRAEEHLHQTSSGDEGHPTAVRRLELARHELGEELRAIAATRKPGWIRRVLVAVNDGPPARWAIDTAVKIAEAWRAELALVHVVSGLGIFPNPVDAIAQETAIEHGARLLDRLARHVPETLAPPVKFLGEGQPGREVISAARDWEADLLVVGGRRPGALAHHAGHGHHRGSVSRLLGLGDVTEYVLSHAKCPVITVSHEPPANAEVGRGVEEGDRPIKLPETEERVAGAAAPAP